MPDIQIVESLLSWKLGAYALAIVVVNTVSFWVKDYFTDRGALNRKKRDVLASHLTPLLHIAEQATSRLLEIVTGSDKKMEAAVSQYRANRPSVQQLASRFLSLQSGANEFDRHESTAFRLINLLTSMQEFTVGTLDIANHVELTEALGYIDNKIPMGLRGNLFMSREGYTPPLSTETQERIAAQFYCADSVFPLGLNVKEFLAEVERGAPGIRMVAPIMEFLAVDPATVRELYAADTNLFSQPTNEQRHLLNVIHSTVYLIDFIQDLGDTPQFEEYRFLLVKILKLWGERVKRLHLYRPDDLKSNSYLASYSEIAARRYKGASYYNQIDHIFSDNMSDKLRKAALAARSRKYQIRHALKIVTETGLAIRSPTSHREYVFRIQDDLKTIYTQFANYMNQERRLIH